MVTTIDTSDRTLNIVSNDDLLIQILSRLPAKSILRFKSVSKHWLSLLSHRHFTLMFNKRSVSPGLFFKDEYIPFEDDENQSTRPFRSLDFCHDPHGIRIVQSCNGLLLCCSDNESERGRKYYVFNPTTKQFVVIPPFIGGGEVYLRISFMGLAFHHTDCEHFKVVRVYPASRDRKSYQIQIYSSDTAKWRILSQSFPLSRQFAFSLYGVYWNGALYWGLRGREPFYFKFDVERLQSLPLPSYQGCRPRPNSFSPHYLGESRGHLHLVEKPRLEGPLHFNVNELLRDHSGWLFKYQVKHHELHTAYPPHDEFDIKILDVVRGEKEEDTFMVVRIYENIIRYNILNKTFKPIFIIRGRFRLIDKTHHYIETIGSF